MLRRIAYLLGGLGALLALVSLASWLWLRSESGSAFVKERIQRAVAGRVNGVLFIGPVSGSPFTGIAVDDLRFERDGDSIAKVERLRISYRFWDLVMGTHALGIDAKGVDVTIREREDGTLNVAGLLKAAPPGDNTEAAKSDKADVAKTDIRLTRLFIENARIAWVPRGKKPLSLDGVDLDASAHIASRSEIDVQRFTIRGGLVPMEAKGRASWSAESIDVQDLQIETSGMKLTGGVRGSFPALSYDLSVRAGPGAVGAKGTTDLSAHRLNADVAITDLDPAVPFGGPHGRLSAKIGASCRWGSGGVTGSVSGNALGGEVAGQRFDRGAFEADLKGHAADLTRASAVLPAGPISAKGRAGFDGDIALDFSFKITDPSQLGSVSSWLSLPKVANLVAGSTVDGRIVKHPGRKADVSIKAFHPGETLKHEVIRNLIKLPSLLHRG